MPQSSGVASIRSDKNAHTPITTQLGAFLHPKTIRILSDPEESISFGHAMDAHKVMLLRIKQIEALTSRTYTRVRRRLKGLLTSDISSVSSSPKKSTTSVGRALPFLSHGLITDEDAEWRRREHESNRTRSITR